jgi:hypothetical protein
MDIGFAFQRDALAPIWEAERAIASFQACRHASGDRGTRKYPLDRR